MQIESVKCPACSKDCRLSFQIADQEKTTWIFCVCGSIFHQKKIDKAYFNDEYAVKYRDWKDLEARFDYFRRAYLPLVEESTYGRRFLDVGFGIDSHIKALTERGWMATGIDLIKNEHIQGDFETQKFREKFDFVLLGDCLGSMSDPLKALFKVSEILNPGGFLFITDPDAEIVYTGGIFNFGNWNPRERWIILSERQAKKTLETMGFDIILARKNTEKRFRNWNNYHILAQRRRA